MKYFWSSKRLTSLTSVWLLLVIQAVSKSNKAAKSVRRRDLEALKDLSDPRSVELKSTENLRAIPFEGKNPEHTRPLRILAVGTSFTWAHGIPDRKQAYPYQITTHPEFVDNIALPATGADYPAICIESMIPKTEDGRERIYDMIILEFSENQTDGLKFLVKRLRERHPEAVLLYVHVWAFVGEVKEKVTGLFPLQYGLDASAEWEWVQNTDGVGFYKIGAHCIREVCDKEQLENIIENPAVNGTVYFFPLPESPMQVLEEGWLVKDWLHLSYVGHRKVAEGVVEFMKLHEDQLYSDKPLGTWNLGDTCYDWYYTPNQAKLIRYEGAELHCHNKNDPLNPDCSLEINQRTGGTLTFHNRFDAKVPVAIGYKSRQFPVLYPKVNLSLNGETAKFIDPQYNRSTRTKAAIQLQNSPHHINAHYKIGWANPGENTIKITTAEEGPEDFRVTGIYLCGSCKDNPDGDMGMGSMNVELDPLQPSM